MQGDFVMVTEVRISQVESAIEEMDGYLDEVMEDQDFPSDFAELQCALHYLAEGGVDWQEVCDMTIEEILVRYHEFLQEDVR